MNVFKECIGFSGLACLSLCITFVFHSKKKYQKPIYKCTKSHIYFIRYYEKKGQKNDEEHLREHHGVGKDDYDDDNDEDGVEIPSNISI